jgi:mono/diheme cytochrome c family protein
VNGVGGDDGADLTRIGERPLEDHVFPAGWSAERTEFAWHVEHLLEPAAVVADSNMPDVGLTREEAAVLAFYLASLRPLDVPTAWTPPDRVRVERLGGREFGGDGATLLRVLCSGCHGERGEGQPVGLHADAYPAIRNLDLLAVAPDELLRRTIETGRTGRRMPGWGAEAGGLQPHEIEAIVAELRSFEPVTVSLEAVRSASVEPGLGREERDCAVCHGLAGEGVIGPSHRSRAFGSLATDRFLHGTLVNGRPGTAMPRFRELTAAELAGVIAYVRSLSGEASSVEAAPMAPGDPERGAGIYQESCARCHGMDGEGGRGPGIGRRGFLEIAGDAFVVESHSAGRCREADGSAPPAVPREDLRDVAASLRRLGPDAKTEKGRPAEGDAKRGEALYGRVCAGCHGAEGEGKAAPALAHAALLGSVNDGFLEATIVRGRRGTAMPRFDADQVRYPRLTGQDVEDVVTFLRAKAKEETK